MQHNGLDKKDIENARMLKSVLLQAQFPLKGDAIVKVASLISWLDNLPSRIESSLIPPCPIKKELKGK